MDIYLSLCYFFTNLFPHLQVGLVRRDKSVTVATMDNCLVSINNKVFFHAFEPQKLVNLILEILHAFLAK